MKNFIFIFFLIFISLQSIAQKRTIEGEVVEIIDGDTFQLLTEEGTYEIHVSAADCPELGQSFGDKAKQFTTDAILNKFVEVITYYSGPERHFFGLVFYDESLGLTQELLKSGLAWEFDSNSPFIKSLEDEAKSNKIGLWQDANPMHPKEWREASRLYPIYPGCEHGDNNFKRNCMSQNIANFVNKNFNLKIAIKSGLKGVHKVIVSFFINEQGNITNINAKGPNSEVEAEGIRVIKLLPKMKPGYENGKPVSLAYTLPIEFGVK